MTQDRRLERVEMRIEEIWPALVCPRPPGLPDGPVTDWPDSALVVLWKAAAAAQKRGHRQPLAWLATADLVALVDRMEAWKRRLVAMEVRA